MKQQNKIFLCKFASAKRDILIQNLNIRAVSYTHLTLPTKA